MIGINNNNINNFEQYCLHLYKSELQRINFMLNSYQRIRIWKIQEQCLFILKTNEMLNRLSNEEKIFCNNYYKLMEKHFERTFLSQLPKQYQSISDPEMIITPNINKHIVMRVNNEIGNFIYDQNKDVDLQHGLIFIGKYRDFKNLIYDGSIDAI